MYVSFMRSTPGYEIHRGLKPSNIPLLAGSAYLNVEEIINNSYSLLACHSIHTAQHMWSGLVFWICQRNVACTTGLSGQFANLSTGDQLSLKLSCLNTWHDQMHAWQFHGEIKQVASVVQWFKHLSVCGDDIQLMAGWVALTSSVQSLRHVSVCGDDLQLTTVWFVHSAVRIWSRSIKSPGMEKVP